MFCTVVVRVGGKPQFSCSNVPKVQADRWATAFRKQVEGKELDFSIDMIEGELDKLPDPHETADALLAISQAEKIERIERASGMLEGSVAVN